MKFALRFEAFFATRKSIDVVGCERQQVCYARGDFIEEGLLGFAEGRFR